MPTLVKVQRPYTYTPSEAHSIAADFRSAASRMRDAARHLRSIGGTLDRTWEGNSKNNFSLLFNPEPGNVESFAQWLDDRANQIEHMTVTVMREVWEYQ